MAIQIVLVAAFAILVLGSVSLWIAVNWQKLAEHRLSKWVGAVFLLVSLTVSAVVIGVFLPESIFGMIVFGVLLLGYALTHRPEKRKRKNGKIRFSDGEEGDIVETDS